MKLFWRKKSKIITFDSFRILHNSARFRSVQALLENRLFLDITVKKASILHVVLDGNDVRSVDRQGFVIRQIRQIDSPDLVSFGQDQKFLFFFQWTSNFVRFEKFVIATTARISTDFDVTSSQIVKMSGRTIIRNL